MKLHEIKAKYGFNQTSFYGFLKEQELIEKVESGYVIGKNHIVGMETLVSENPRGETPAQVTQVSVSTEAIPRLVEMYENSSWTNLYSADVQFKTVNSKLLEIINKIEIISSQLAELRQHVKE